MNFANLFGDKNSITLHVVSGKKYFDGLVGLTGLIIFTQQEDGTLCVSRNDGMTMFEIKDYEWDGTAYKSVTTAKGATTFGGRVKAKLGASALFSDHMKGKSKSKGHQLHIDRSTTVDKEIKNTAYMTLKNIQSNEVFTFGFQCDSKINLTIRNMLYKVEP